jgi:hypothetical protein
VLRGLGLVTNDLRPTCVRRSYGFPFDDATAKAVHADLRAAGIYDDANALIGSAKAVRS